MSPGANILAAAGAGAGAATNIATNSLWVVKTRLQIPHKMKQAVSRSSLWYISCRAPSYAWHGRNMGSQAVAIEEIEANDSNENKFHRWQLEETKVLIAAKNQYELGKLESIESAGIQRKGKWKKIEIICKQRGVQRSAEQCKSRWRRLMLTYLQIKRWEENKTSELLSYWSMKLDERRGRGILLSTLDQSTYNLLDKLYNSRADAVKDGLIEDAFEEVAEFGSVEDVLPSLKEKSEIEGTINLNILSASEEESCESHRTGSQIFSAEAKVCNQKQVEWVAGATFSIEEGDRTNSFSSSSGLVVSHGMESGKLAGAAASVENMLQDRRHNGQVAGTAGPIEESHEVLRASAASAETNVIDKQLCKQDTGTSASIPVIGECGSTDMNVTTLKNNLEEGDSTQANLLLSVFVEGTDEKQGWHVFNTAASMEETHPCTQFSSTGLEVCHARQTEQIAELATFAAKTHEKHITSSDPVGAGEKVCNEVQSEQVAGKEMSMGTVLAGNVIGGVQEKCCEDIYGLHPSKGQGMGTVLGSTGQSSKAVLGEKFQCGNDEGSPNKESASIGAVVLDTMQREQIACSEVSKSTPLAVHTGEWRPEDSHSFQSQGVAGSEGSKGSPATANAIVGVQERMLEDSHSLPYNKCHGVDMPLAENARDSLNNTLIWHSQSGNVGSCNQETKYHAAAVQDKNTITTAEQRTLFMGSGESCEGKKVEAFERPAADSPETSEKGSLKEKGLQLYDGSKYDDDVLMYVPAAIGNVIRIMGQQVGAQPSRQVPLLHQLLTCIVS